MDCFCCCNDTSVSWKPFPWHKIYIKWFAQFFGRRHFASNYVPTHYCVSISIQCSYSAFTSWVLFRSLNAFLKLFLYDVPLKRGLAPFRLLSELLAKGVSLTPGMDKYGRWNGRFLVWYGMEDFMYGMELHGRFCLLWKIFIPFHSMPCWKHTRNS